MLTTRLRQTHRMLQAGSNSADSIEIGNKFSLLEYLQAEDPQRQQTLWKQHYLAHCCNAATGFGAHVL
jgi:hypothetical protein